MRSVRFIRPVLQSRRFLSANSVIKCDHYSLDTVVVDWSEPLADIEASLNSSNVQKSATESIRVLCLNQAHNYLKPEKVKSFIRFLQSSFNIKIFGFVNSPTDPHFKSLAAAVELPVLSYIAAPKADTSTMEMTKEDGTIGPVPVPPPNAIPARYILGDVASGATIYAQGQSLIIRGNVMRGGEVIADENIHIIGTLAGKATAGLLGSENSCITATKFEPKSVAIGSTRVFDSSVSLQKCLSESVRVTLLDQDRASKLADGDFVYVENGVEGIVAAETVLEINGLKRKTVPNSRDKLYIQVLPSLNNY